MPIQLANPINAQAHAPPMINEPRRTANSSPCFIAPLAHCVVVVGPAHDCPPPQVLTVRPQKGPSMFAMLRAQRIRRAALRIWLSHRYTALGQDDSEPLPAAAATDTQADKSEDRTDADMV